jgi:hypothetical protein
MEDFEENKINEYYTLRKVKQKPKIVDTSTIEEELEENYMHHETKEQEGEMNSMFTNPALPVVTGAGDFHRGRGFEPADAALVQSNNLAVIQSLIAQNNQMINESISRNSKENALIVKDNQIALLTMQNNNTMMMAQLQSAIDKLAMRIECCMPVPTPTRT